MMLPPIETPTYKTTLPLTKQEITYRPYLTKEEKIMMMAYESENTTSLLDAVAQIIKNCCGDTIKDPMQLPECDLEYLFLKLRSASVNEIASPTFKCNSLDNKTDCDGIVLTAIDFSSLEPVIEESHTNKFILDEKKGIGVVLKYITLGDVKKIAENKNIKTQTDTTIEILKKSIDYVFDKDSVYHAKDSTDEELTEWILSLNSDQFKKLTSFFESSPKITWSGEGICSKCGTKHPITLKGLTDFFM